MEQKVTLSSLITYGQLLQNDVGDGHYGLPPLDGTVGDILKWQLGNDEKFDSFSRQKSFEDHIGGSVYVCGYDGVVLTLCTTGCGEIETENPYDAQVCVDIELPGRKITGKAALLTKETVNKLLPSYKE
jgi:hypothetical protein